MADFFDVVLGRRSVRRFTDAPVSDADLAKIFDAVRWAPSWANTQVWEIVAVRDAATRAHLQECVPPTNPSYKGMAEAQVVLCLCAKMKSAGYYKGEVRSEFGDWFLHDLGIAGAHVTLAAQALGLATVFVGIFDRVKVRALLAIPEEYAIVTLIPVGVGAVPAAAPKRREVSEFVHRDRF